MILGHMAVTKIKCTPLFPARDALQHEVKAWWKVARQKLGKTLQAIFFVNEHNTNMNPQAIKKVTIFKVIPEEKQQLVEEKDAHNLRNVLQVLCKSFIQWF